MRKAAIVALLAALAGAGCNDAELKDLKKGQQEVLAKLDSLDKAVAGLKAAQAAPQRPAAPDPNKVYTIPTTGSAVRGPKDAKVTIVEFSDFQCPFCAQSAGMVDDVLKQYPKDVNFVYKQFPLTSIHPMALGAAKAAVAAGKQGKFWEMHDAMFQSKGLLQPDKLKEYASKIPGLDVPRWEKDMNSPDVQAVIDADTKDAAAAEVRGTPTFFVGGKRLQNRSADGFKTMIDEALKTGGDAQKKG